MYPDTDECLRENLLLNMQNVYETVSYAYLETTTHDIAVRFFSDAACTIPVEPGSLTVNVFATVETQVVDEGVLTTEPPFNTATQSYQTFGQTFLVGRRMTWQEISTRRWDGQQQEIEANPVVTTNYRYKLAPGTGYIIVN